MRVDWFEHFAPDGKAVAGYEVLELATDGKVAMSWFVPKGHANPEDDTWTQVNPTVIGQNGNRKFMVRAVFQEGLDNRKSYSSRARTGEAPEDSEPDRLRDHGCTESRWTGYDIKGTDTYQSRVRDVVAGLVAKMPAKSTAATLLFQDKVFTDGAGLEPMDSSVGYEITSLATPGSTWQRDWWYLDIGEVLTGAEDGDFRTNAYSCGDPKDSLPLCGSSGKVYPMKERGSSDANGKALLAKGKSPRKIGILVTDWYDALVAGQSGRDDVYYGWYRSMLDFTEAGNDLKNAVLRSGEVSGIFASRKHILRRDWQPLWDRVSGCQMR